MGSAPTATETRHHRIPEPRHSYQSCPLAHKTSQSERATQECLTARSRNRYPGEAYCNQAAPKREPDIPQIPISLLAGQQAGMHEPEADQDIPGIQHHPYPRCTDGSEMRRQENDGGTEYDDRNTVTVERQFRPPMG